MQVQILKPSLEMTTGFLGNAVMPKRILTSHGCSHEVLRRPPLLCLGLSLIKFLKNSTPFRIQNIML